MTSIIELPEDCVAQILSLTSPKDVLQFSATSKHFSSVSKSNEVWAKFLPSHYADIVSQSSSSIPRNQFGSKRDVFVNLCTDPILLDNNTKSFALDKWSGKICYRLGSRSLSIIWGNDRHYWTWELLLGSRCKNTRACKFSECAVLGNMCWLDIKGKISTTLLSPNTTYCAYFLFSLIIDSSADFICEPVAVSIDVVNEDGLPIDDRYTPENKHFYLEAPGYAVSRGRYLNELPVARRDGLLEIKMGSYRVGIDIQSRSAFLKMTLRNVEKLYWKNGLIVHGIEVRPLLLVGLITTPICNYTGQFR